MEFVHVGDNHAEFIVDGGGVDSTSDAAEIFDNHVSSAFVVKIILVTISDPG